MNVVSSSQHNVKTERYVEMCPYNGVHVCFASISSMVIDEKEKEDYCSNENYDTCPIFLSMMLRKR